MFVYKFEPLAKSCYDARDEIIEILSDLIRDNLTRRRAVIEKLRSYGGDIAKLGAKHMKTGDVDVLVVAIATSGLSTQRGAVLDDAIVSRAAYSMMLLWPAGYMTSAGT